MPQGSATLSPLVHDALGGFSQVSDRPWLGFAGAGALRGLRIRGYWRGGWNGQGGMQLPTTLDCSMRDTPCSGYSWGRDFVPPDMGVLQGIPIDVPSPWLANEFKEFGYGKMVCTSGSPVRGVGGEACTEHEEVWCICGVQDEDRGEERTNRNVDLRAKRRVRNVELLLLD